MQSIELISQGRITRLAQSSCLLGEPDIISIKQIKSTSSLFSRDKKIEDNQENYINGLIFPTTAHFSSFISSRYKAKDPSKHTVKAKLFMFDVLILILRHSARKIYKYKSAYLAQWKWKPSIYEDSQCHLPILITSVRTIVRFCVLCSPWIIQGLYCTTSLTV